MLSRPIPVPKPTPRVIAKKAAQAREAKALRECYAEVDRRDMGCCRVCGRWTDPAAEGCEHGRSRHHLVYRSKGGEHETWNVLTLCGACDELVHRSGRLRLRGDADLRDAATGKFCGVTVERWTDAGAWRVEGCV